jgi:hypothetical protein
VEALKSLGLSKGDKVLFPEFICGDLLSALHPLCLRPVWYAVGHDLKPVADPDGWPEARAVLAVNYFGFAQDLEPFNEYAKRTGATVIEDNAHGFLSRDGCGRLLGTRSALGLFSYRKTLLLGRGAGLFLSRKDLQINRPVQLSFIRSSFPIEIWVRRCLISIFRTQIISYIVMRIIRQLRKLRGLSEIPFQRFDAEVEIPGEPNPDLFLITNLKNNTFKLEIQRRRNLYERLSIQAKLLDLKLVYPDLGKYTVPYGLAIFADDETKIAQLAANNHLDYFRWPQLPVEVLARGSKHYSEIYLINFL